MTMKNRLKKHSLKFISILLSFFLWIYVINSEKMIFEKTIELEYILPPGLVFSKIPLHEIHIIVEGPKAFSRMVIDNKERFKVDLKKSDLSKKQLLNFNLEIDPAQLNLPLGMKVNRIQPRKINVALEKKIKKLLPLTLNFSGNLPEGLEMDNYFLEPSEMEVYGPASVIARLKSISIRPIELEGLLGSDQVNADIQLPDERLTVDLNQVIKFNYQIKLVNSHLNFRNLPIQIKNKTNKNFVLNAEFANVKIFVPKNLQNSQSTILNGIQVWGELPENAEGQSIVPLKVNLPPNIQLLEVTPKSIIVNMQ